MSQAAEEAPVMGLGVEQRQLLVQGLMSLASMVQQRRYALDRQAWSDERNATRSAERTFRVAEPTVRTMSSAEWAAASQNQVRGEGSERSVVHRHGWVTVWVGPVSDDRVGLLATGGADAGHPPTVSASVSCASYDTALSLADELLAGGPDKVDRLHTFAALTAQRAAAAAHDLTEPEHVRHARAAAAVRAVWSGPRLAPLAETVVNSGAFGALAWRLHELEERGYRYQDVLRRIDAARMLGHTVVDPAALAEYFVEQTSANLHVINLDDAEQDRSSARSGNPRHRAGRGQPGSRRGPAGGPVNDTSASPRQSGQSRAGQGRAAHVDPARIRVEQQTIAPLLVEAFGQHTAELVQRDRRGYPELRRYLSQLHRQGRPVAAMLRDVPSHRLTEVAHPARYVRTVVGNHSPTTPLRQAGPDRAAMEAVVREAVDAGTADKVVACRTWPKLARHLQGFSAEGLPVTQMLGALPATRVAYADYPASYALRLLERDATRRRTAASDGHDPAPPRRPRPHPTTQQHDATSAPDSARPARNREPESPDPAAPAATPSPQTRRRAAARDTRAVLAVDGRGVVDASLVEAVSDEPDPGPAAATAAAAGPGEPAPPNTAPTAHEGQTRWTLHPDDAIDRVGLEAALGVVDSVEQAERLEQRLGPASSATRPAGHHPAELTAGPSVPPSVSPPNAAAAPDTGEHSELGELGGQDADGHEPRGSGGDGDLRGQRDAAERAADAEARHAAGAAARAEVTYTPDTTATDPAETARRTRAARPPVHRPPAPHRESSPRR